MHIKQSKQNKAFSQRPLVTDHKLKIEWENLHIIEPTDGHLENQDKDISIHTAYTYSHGKITFIEFYISTYRHLHVRAHTINLTITANANINIIIEQILVRIKVVSFQRSTERLNRTSFPDAFRQGIQEGREQHAWRPAGRTALSYKLLAWEPQGKHLGADLREQEEV